MDESDSEGEQGQRRGDANDGEMYPVDGMFASEKEKAQIMGMREVEREQIIAERALEVDRQRQRRMLRQMIAEDTGKAKKRTADSADLDDERHSKSRQRTGKGETAMDSLRRARAERQKRREDHERRRDTYSPRRDSPDADSDNDYRRSRTPEKEEKEQAPAELRDYDRVRLGRNEFAQVCFTPGFEPAITGCFIRIALGPHPETGVEQYRMAHIKGTPSASIFATCREGN